MMKGFTLLFPFSVDLQTKEKLHLDQMENPGIPDLFVGCNDFRGLWNVSSRETSSIF